MIKTGQILNNTYEVRESIGSGSGGIIFKAYHLRMKKVVAIKLVKNEVKGKVDIRTEVDVLKNLKNDYLPTVIDFVEDGEDIYTVMEFIEGKNFKQLIESGKTFSEKSVRKYAKQLCRAVSYLHNHNPPIIHSDIKPANIMLTPEDNICLIDFNISMISNNGVSEALGGSRGFAAPEQFKRIISVPASVGSFQERTRFVDNDETEILPDDEPRTNSTAKTKNAARAFVDIRSDVYGIGASVYYILTGRVPYNGKTDFRGIHSSARIKEVIDKAMNPNAAKRYSNTDELEKALGSYVSRKAVFGSVSGIAVIAAAVALINSGVFDRISDISEEAEMAAVTSVSSEEIAETVTVSPETETELITDTETITETASEVKTMPSLMYLTVDKAQKICEDNSIEYEIKKVNTHVFNSGIVIGQSVSAGSIIDDSSKVEVMVSEKVIISVVTEESTITETMPTTVAETTTTEKITTTNDNWWATILDDDSTNLKLNCESKYLAVGDEYKLSINGNVNKSPIKWSTSDKTVATVSSNGNVKGISAGTAYIYAKVEGLTLKCKVKVHNSESTESEDNLWKTPPDNGSYFDEGKKVAEGGTSTNWSQAVVMYTYNNIEEGEETGKNPFDETLLNADNTIVVTYKSAKAPELIFQSWSGGDDWAKIPANDTYSTAGIAVFTYDYMTAMYQSEDFSTLDAVYIGDTGADLTVIGVYVVPKSVIEGAR